MCCFLFGLSLLYSVRWLNVVCSRGESRVYIFMLDISLAFHICVSYDMYAVRISFFELFTTHTYLTLLCLCARFSLFLITNEYEPITSTSLGVHFVEKKRLVSTASKRGRRRSGSSTVSEDGGAAPGVWQESFMYFAYVELVNLS